MTVESSERKSSSGRPIVLLPPANEVCEGYVFTGACLSGGGGRAWWRGGGGAWLPGGWWWWGACMMWGGVRGVGGHVWCQGGMCGARGVCMVWGHACCWGGGMHGAWGGMCGAREGACVWCRGACMVPGGSCMGYDEIRSMSGRYASYWNVFLLSVRSLIMEEAIKWKSCKNNSLLRQ